MPETPIERRFGSITRTLSGEEGVTLGSGRRGFGSGALQVEGRIFAMVVDGGLVLKLSKDRVGAFLVVGLISGFGVQVLYNITMSAGLAPVKGLTLPLMSYGGSSLVATLAAFGLILNVRMRRFTN